MEITDSLYFYLQPLINEYKKTVLVWICAYISALTVQPAFYTLLWREDFHECTAQCTQTQKWLAAGGEGREWKEAQCVGLSLQPGNSGISAISALMYPSLAGNKVGHMSQRIKYRPRHKRAAGKQKKTTWSPFPLTEIVFSGCYA